MNKSAFYHSPQYNIRESLMLTLGEFVGCFGDRGERMRQVLRGYVEKSRVKRKEKRHGASLDSSLEELSKP